MRKFFSCKFHVSLQFLLLLGFVCLLPEKGKSQKRQLTPSDTVSKVAYIDHSRLRKEFKEFAAAKQKMAKENEAGKKSFEQALQAEDRQTKKQSKADTSAKTLPQRTLKQAEIFNAYQAAQKKRNAERITLMQEYERKIVLAIDSVVAEGGFTDVKPFIKEPFNQRGANITDLILKKLN